MTRFGRLEFDDKKGPRSQLARGEDVRDEQYFYDQATRFWLAGDFEPALRNYSRALEVNNAFFPAWLSQILMLLELGEYSEAAVWSDKAMEMFPEHPELLAAKAVAYARDGKIQKALAYSDNSVGQDNITSRVWLARAEVLTNRQSRVAESCISKAVSIAGNKSPIVRLEAGRRVGGLRRHAGRGADAGAEGRKRAPGYLRLRPTGADRRHRGGRTRRGRSH